MHSRSFLCAWRRGALIALVAPLLLTLCFPTPARADASVTVNTTADTTDPCATSGSGTCSLRDAVAFANANDSVTITFDNVTFPPGTPKTIVLNGPGGTLRLSRDTGSGTTIDGTGHQVAVDGGGSVTVFFVQDATAVLTGVTIQHGSAPASNGGGILNEGTLRVTNSTLANNSASQGAGIYSFGLGSVTVTNSTFSGNSAAQGAGLWNSNTATVTDSTFSGNSASQSGGGINAASRLTVTNSTLSGNSAPAGNGGGIFVTSTAPTLTNTIVSGNTGGDISGNITDGGHNLIGPTPNPLLASLGVYGGPTRTLALLPGSPAIDQGSCSTGYTDQRGVAQVGSACDIGAFESQQFSIMPTGGDNQSTGLTTAFPTPLTVKVTGAPNEPVQGGQVTFTAPPSGASANLAVDPATINASGVASVTATANGTLGTYQVQANGAGITLTALFTLTNTSLNCVVTSTQDPTESGRLTLRQAVEATNGGGCGGDRITFDSTVFPPGTPETIALAAANGPLVLTRTTGSTTIDGTGHQVAVDGNNAVTVFTINDGVTTTLTGLTIQHGKAPGTDLGGGILNVGTLTVTDSTFAGNSASQGGGIFNFFNGTLTVTNCIFSGNTASQNGGGILNLGTLVMTNSTLSGNSADGGGGINNNGMLTMTNSTLSGNSAAQGAGIINSNTVTMTDSTLSGNTATQSGGGIDTAAGTLTATSSTLSGNSAPPDNGGGIVIGPRPVTVTNTIVTGNTGGDISGTFTNGGHNLIGPTPNPLLAPLGNYGGPTQTVALLPGSPAIDAGSCTTGYHDQRGIAQVSTACDIGAFESQGFLLGLAGGYNQSTGADSAFAQPLVVIVTSAHGEPVQGGQVTFTAPTSGAAATFATNPATVGAGLTASVTATANDTAGVYSVTASAAGAGSASFALINFPVITGITPSSGGTVGGNHVSFTGHGFGTSAANVSVTMGGITAPVASVADTTLVVTAPAHAAGVVDVVITVNGQGVTALGGYAYGAVTPLPNPQPPGNPAGTANPLPNPRISGGTPGNANTQPQTRPANGSQGVPPPNPAPPPRP